MPALKMTALSFNLTEFPEQLHSVIACSYSTPLKRLPGFEWTPKMRAVYAV